MLLRLLNAWFWLALRALVLHPLRLLFLPAERKGRPAFLAEYTVEGLVPYSAQERAGLHRFGGCINCGLCDAVCPLVGGDFRGPSIFALAYSRATPELPALRETLATLDRCGACTRCRDACPRSVPLLDIFAFTRRKLAEVDAALPPRRAPVALPEHAP